MSRFPLTPNRGSFWLISAGLGLISLPGCSISDRTPPAVEVRTITVDRPVAVSCLKLSDIPAEPAKIGDKLTGDARRDLDLVAGSATRLRSWGLTMAAMLRGCAK